MSCMMESLTGTRHRLGNIHGSNLANLENIQRREMGNQARHNLCRHCTYPACSIGTCSCQWNHHCSTHHSHQCRHQSHMCHRSVCTSSSSYRQDHGGHTKGNRHMPNQSEASERSRSGPAGSASKEAAHGSDMMLSYFARNDHRKGQTCFPPCM